MKSVAIIPARLASTRLPRKMLREIAGKPLVGWVYEAVRSSPLLSDVIIATDSEEIMEACHRHDWKAQMTSSTHRSGTERVQEVSNSISADIYVNVQGDEPLVRPEQIAALLEVMADPATQVGPLVSEQHMHKVLSYLERGRAEGARVVTGGARVTTGTLSKGYFVAPTVFDNCRDDMAIVREEIFGPVMSVLEFEDEQEVVERANATEFGLAAGVFTNDLTRAHRVIARLQAGTCWINQYNVTPIELPFGGVKLSGLGRENGRAAIEHYTQLKSVYVAMGDIEAPY